MQIDTDYRPGIDVDLTLEGGDIDMLLKGKEVEDRDGDVYVTVRLKEAKTNPSDGSKDESPLEYLERTWNEPRYGETPIQHFNRIHGVSE